MEMAEKRVFTLKLMGNSVLPCNQILMTYQEKEERKRKYIEGERKRTRERKPEEHQQWRRCGKQKSHPINMI
jgi:hypothetical protein